MSEQNYTLGNPLVIKPTGGLKYAYLGTFGPGEPPAFEVEYRRCDRDDVTLSEERMPESNGRYRLIYMFQNYGISDAEVVITEGTAMDNANGLSDSVQPDGI